MELPVNTPDGAAPAWAYTGGKAFDAALPCIVFVHGALNDHSVWTLLARWFAHHGRSVLAVDLPGHGRSGGLPLASVEAAADWLLAALDAAGVQHAALVGHSMGSLIALEAAARAPARASTLAMVGTAYPMKVSDLLLTTSRDDPLRAIEMVNAFSHSGFAAKPSYPGPGTWLHGADRALMRRVQAGQTAVNLFHHDFSVCNAYAGGTAAAAKVACASHLIVGARDQMTTPKQAREIAAALKATVHTVPAGHALMAEAPDAVLAALRVALG
jgi:pimeloyl-ACP methyl ester carboxylesterase